MREIKFRVWDEEFQNYAPIECVLGFIVGDEKGQTFYIKNTEYLIEQYTGLKDFFTDQECYENDLIDWKDMHTGKIVRFKVIFKDGCFYGERLDSPNVHYQLSILLCRTMHSDAGKIIGNIHEDKK